MILLINWFCRPYSKFPSLRCSRAQSWLSASRKQGGTPRTGAVDSNTFRVSQVTDVARLKMFRHITWEGRENARLRLVIQKQAWR